MRTKTKVTLAASFVGVVAMAAAAFGQSGSGAPPENKQSDRRATAERNRDGCPDRIGRRMGRLVHSDSKVQFRDDGFGTVTVDTGTVSAIDHAKKKIEIKRADGEKVTAAATDDTRVCKDGEKSSFDAIKVGDFARLFQVHSDQFNGLRRIGVSTPGNEPAAPQRSKDRPAPSADSSPEKKSG